MHRRGSDRVFRSISFSVFSIGSRGPNSWKVNIVGETVSGAGARPPALFPTGFVVNFIASSYLGGGSSLPLLLLPLGIFLQATTQLHCFLKSPPGKEVKHFATTCKAGHKQFPMARCQRLFARDLVRNKKGGFFLAVLVWVSGLLTLPHLGDVHALDIDDQTRASHIRTT